MENKELAVNALINQIVSDEGNLSESLIEIHNFIVHDLNLSTLPNQMNDWLYDTYKLAKYIKQIEIEHLPKASQNNKVLESIIEEKENRIKILEDRLETRGKSINALEKICDLQGINTSHLKIKK